jgi:predicted amidohydrolase
VRHIHRKIFLPTYGLFDEERFVERGVEVKAFETSWGRAARLVCEDAWHSLTGTIAALDGAQIILLSAAAPSRGIWPRADDTPGPYTLNRWERLARDIAEEHGVFVSLAHLVGSEGGKIFAGGSVVVGPRGDLRARAPIFSEAIVSVAADMDDITRARADAPLLSDLRTVLPYMMKNLHEVYDRALQGGSPDPLTLTVSANSSAAVRTRSTATAPLAPSREGKPAIAANAAQLLPVITLQRCIPPP